MVQDSPLIVLLFSVLALRPKRLIVRRGGRAAGNATMGRRCGVLGSAH